MTFFMPSRGRFAETNIVQEMGRNTNSTDYISHCSITDAVEKTKHISSSDKALHLVNTLDIILSESTYTAAILVPAVYFKFHKYNLTKKRCSSKIRT